MTTENFDPVMTCGAPCPAAVYGKGTDCIEKRVKKAVERKLRKCRGGVKPRRT